MFKVKESQTSQEIELDSTSAVSPDSIVPEQAQIDVPKSFWRCYWKQCTFIALLVICSVMLSFETNAQAGVQEIPTVNLFDPEGFVFLVHCPISYLKQDTSFKGIPPFNTDSSGSDELRRRRLYQNYNKRIEVNKKSANNYFPNRTYLVEVTSITTTVDGTEVSSLYYCGLTKHFYDDCNNSFIACSSPGPIFDIPSRDHIDIIWVNNLNPGSVPPSTQTCMISTYDPDTLVPNYCLQMVKKNFTQTFLDPTKMSMSSPTFLERRINSTNWPMVAHLHGAEIRPTFDGNPLSWINNADYQDGIYGIATFSLDQECYYSAFDEIIDNQSYSPPSIVLRDIRNNKTTKNYKINRYNNRQNPGTLWYHDHSMHLTSFNVKNGLSGFYILRDELVEQQIGVNHHNEKLVMLAEFSFIHNLNNTIFQQDTVYRFKFLNNWFDDDDYMTPRISFSYRNCTDNIQDRETFSIIGADSSLFNISIDNQVSFVVSQAERLELLIKFDGGQQEFAICSDTDISDFPTPAGHNGKSSGKKLKPITGIKLSPPTQRYPNNRTQINNVQLSVPFTNLSLTPEADIAKTRMRPLIWVGKQVFTINGRTDFHGGWSEDPTLGTTEDWFIINNIYFGHPIHVHLLNYEVVREYHVRYLIPPNADKNSPLKYACGFYEMDFVLAAVKLAKSCDSQLATYLPNIYVNGSIDYNYLCENLKAIENLTCVVTALGIVFPENQFDNQTRVGGIDVRQKLTLQELPSFLDTKKYNITPPVDPNDPSPYKYVSDGGKPSPKPYYARWKDTALVEAFRVLQFRIRWTKSNYTEADKAAGTYFHVPNDQLREYPGYVYHCHILPHEDNEMMRPIMVQLPPGAALNEKTPCNYNIESKKKVLSWKDKYNCINKRCGDIPT